MSAPEHKFVSANRRVREDRRFVVGRGNYVADVKRDGTLHVALVPSQHTAARIVAIDATAALAMPGVHLVVTGADLAAAVEPLMNGLDTPDVRRFPLAVGQVRYNGEWVAAVVAESRALAEDAAELVEVEYEPLPFVLDAEEALRPDSTPVHPGHGSNVLLDRTFVWGDVERHFAESPHQLSLRVKWGRNSTVPIETFGVLASWDPWREILDVWASIQMPKYPDQIARAMRLPANAVRVHHDVDVGGSYGVKRGIKHTVLAGYISRRLNRPVRLMEDRLENMRAGDAHGPERLFDVSVAFDERGIVRSMKMRALDNVGAYAGRSPFQLGKPIGAIVGPYRIESVQYQAMAVTTNKAVQEAVRGFGQSPTNYAIETMIDRVAVALGLDRIEVRRRNFIRTEEFPYLIPSGTRYDSGDYHTVVDKVLAHVDWPALQAERDRLRQSGLLAGIGVSRLPGAERRQFRIRAAAQSEECHHDLDGFLPHQRRCARPHHGDDPYDVIRTGTRDARRHGDRRGPGDRPRAHPHRAAGLAQLPAEQLAGRQPHGDHAGRRRVPRRPEAQAEADPDRGAAVRTAGARGPLCGRNGERARGRRPPRLDRLGHDRAPAIPPAAARHRSRAGGQPRVPGADRRPTADGRWPRPDVSLSLLRVPLGAGRHRSRSRQDGAAALRHRP